MATNFKWSSLLPRQLDAAFAVASGHDHDGVNSKEIAGTTASKKIFTYKVEDLAAGADITTRAILEMPTGIDGTITKASIISNGTPADIDDSNTCVVQLLNGTNSIVSKTYDADPVFPAENVSDDLGTLSATYKVLNAGDMLHLVVTNGRTADPPAFIVQVEYTVATA